MKSNHPSLHETQGGSVALGEPGDDVACTSRDTCYGPMKSGIRIRDGSTSGTHWCTMGFLVTVNGTTDEQMLTAGHCYFAGVGTNWYHKAYGLLGSEADRSAYGEDGYDVMTVRFPDTQNSELIYGVSGPQQLTGSRDPITGEGVCFSGAKTDAVKCGTVTAAIYTWTSETCSCSVWGSRSSFSPLHGDSGAPLYSRVYITNTSTPYWLNTPLGIVDHEAGMFATVSAAEWTYGVTIYR